MPSISRSGTFTAAIMTTFLSYNLAYADLCNRVITGSSMAFYQGKYGSAGGDGYCHARTGNEANTTAAVGTQAACRQATSSLFKQFERDQGANFSDCIFRPPSQSSDGHQQPGDDSQSLALAKCDAASESLKDAFAADCEFGTCNLSMNEIRAYCPAAGRRGRIAWAEKILKEFNEHKRNEPPANAKQGYKVSVCNKGSGSAWVAHLAYLDMPDSKNPWKTAWWHVKEGECVDTLQFEHRNQSVESFWTFAQFDNGQFWPKQELDTELTQYRWCLPKVPGKELLSEVILGRSYPCGNDALRFFEESEGSASAANGQALSVVTVDISPQGARSDKQNSDQDTTGIDEPTDLKTLMEAGKKPNFIRVNRKGAPILKKPEFDPKDKQNIYFEAKGYELFYVKSVKISSGGSEAEVEVSVDDGLYWILVPLTARHDFYFCESDTCFTKMAKMSP